jgi:hypothetical protein
MTVNPYRPPYRADYTTRAAFFIGRGWVWIKWRHSEPNKHAAILAKAEELGAQRWDYGNADHEETSRFHH